MSATAESVTQSTQTSNHVPNADPNALLVRPSITTESDFDALWDKGAFDTPDEAKTRAEKAQPEKQVKTKVPAELAPEPEAQTTETDELEAAGKAQEEAPADETPSKTYTTLGDYLKEAQIDEESFMDLPIPVKVEGETRNITLKDLQKSYQLEGTVAARLMQVTEDRKAFEAEQAQVRTALKSAAEQAQALYQDAHTQLLAEYQGIDWKILEQQDPGRAALLQQQYQTRANQISGRLQQLTQAKEAEARRAHEDYVKALPQQREKLLDLNPTWRDAAKFEADRKVMIDYGKSRGLTDEQLSSITDPAAVMILHDAARYQTLQVAKPAVLKQVRAAPQMARPGARVDRNPQATSYKQATERMRQNPRDVDAQAAVFDHFV